MPPLLFRPKYDLFEEHHDRLRMSPDPESAETLFRERLRKAKLVTQVRTGLYLVVYFGVVASVVGFLLTGIDAAAAIRLAVQVAASVASSLTLVSLLGIFACTRYLTLADVELYHYGAEARSA